ncbi:MAG: translocation/assembly module TamB domain-containing protein [Candidatus Omnitrophota bacterium]
MRIRKRLFVLAAVGVVLCAGMLSVYCFLFTMKGSSFLGRIALSRYFKTRQITVGAEEGILAGTLTYKDIELKDLQGLPSGSFLRIQRLTVTTAFPDIRRSTVEVYNGRLRPAGFEPIVFSGTYRNGDADLSFYTRSLDWRQTLSLFPRVSSVLKSFSGTAMDVDGRLSGPLTQPSLKGTFQAAEFLGKRFSVVESPSSFEFRVTNVVPKFRLEGEIVFKSGTIRIMDRSTMTLLESKVLFSGDPKTPTFQVKAEATIEGVRIYLTFNGTVQQPELVLTSDPPMPQERLLLMLATGKGWQSLDKALEERALSPNIAGDFVDYFFLSGSKNRLAQRLGLNILSVSYDDQTKGVKVEKTVTDRLKARVGIEEKKTEATRTTTETLGTGVQVTGSISIEGERKIKQVQDQADPTKQNAPPEDAVVLKYKKEF